ncbi:MAG: ABC transporter substrate-binding protein [Chloroflexia bacterium]|nr:ABC transporter substrate-binding protein [Chloroflexia bacterium]
MAQQQWADTIRALEARKLHRRRLLQTGAVATAAAVPATTGLLSPMRVAAQSDPTQLVVLDNIQGGNWLYLDPGLIYEINPQAAMQLVYECLYHIPDGSNVSQVEPLLALDFPTFSDDGLTATIALRPGVTFHGTGNAMTADDWVWSWNRLRYLLGNASFLFTDFIESVSAPDPETLEVTLLLPNAALPAILTSTPFSVVDSVAAQENGGSAEENAAEEGVDTLTDWLNEGNSVGTGPYTLTQWDISGEIIIKANADYWGDAAGFERIIFRNVADTGTQLQLLETGEADIAFAVDPDRIGQVESNPGLQLIEGPSLAHEYLAMHTGEEVGGPLASQEARQAIAHAVDYAGIIDGLMGGRAVRPATAVTLGLLGAAEVEDLAYQTDLARANELWEASGNGPTELTLTWGAGQTAPGGLNRDILAAKLQVDIQQIDGVTVTLSPMDPTQRLQEYRDGNLQFTMSDWTPDYADVHAYADPFGGSEGAASRRVAFSNDEIDSLLADGIGELDEAARLEDYVRIQEIMVDEVAFLVEFQPNYVMPAAASVQGAEPHGTYILQLRYASKEA